MRRLESKPWRAGAIAVGGLLALVPTQGAFADASVSVNPATAAPGATVTISGNVPTEGCPASAVPQLTSMATLFPPSGFGPQVTRDAAGNFTSTYAIPGSTPPGSYSVGIRCAGGNVGVTANVTVVLASAASIDASPPSVVAGAATVFNGRVSAGDCGAGGQIQLTSNSDLFPPDGFGPRATRDGNGTFSVSYSVPGATPPGEYRVGIRCGGGNVGVATTLRVTQATTGSTVAAPATTVASPGTTLTTGQESSDTSTNAAWPIAVGSLALIIVVLTVLLVRSRRTTT